MTAAILHWRLIYDFRTVHLIVNVVSAYLRKEKRFFAKQFIKNQPFVQKSRKTHQNVENVRQKVTLTVETLGTVTVGTEVINRARDR